MKGIQTVLGTINPDELGNTLAHEHLLVDGRVWFEEPTDPIYKEVAHTPVDIRNIWALRRAGHFVVDNQVLTDVDLAVEELSYFKKAGGQTIFDVTSKIGRNIRGVKEISQKSGVNVVMGCAYYTEASHPPEVAKMSVDDLVMDILHDLTEGMDGTDVKAGIIGEIGITPGRITEREERVLKAASKAHLETAAPITVHAWAPWLGPAASRALQVLDVFEREGVDLSRVYMSHTDWTYCRARNWEYVKKVADRGAFVSFDGFGAFEWPHGFESFGIVAPTDYERVLGVKELIEGGYLNQIVLSHDICWKSHLRRYGGNGYDHILRSVTKIFKSVGIGDREIKTMLVDNPRRIIAP